jgi:cellulose synthase/poly-beta-1,6-N-acetylglucosamine synthase-like glycosyltransferase
MQKITALLHTENDALRLGRCLECLYPCDEILVIDHGSSDGTLQVAREYGARVVGAERGALPSSYLRLANAPWVLCLESRESLTESLAASLYEWKSEDVPESARVPAFSMYLREETATGWLEHPTAQTRLIPWGWNRWQGRLPANDPAAVSLEGEILRFVLP